ncbi:radical SAM family heme chaperone HemW [Planctobacterium marinum]|uniref:radical SAM family heme chaperone HemW n=1 Tax=Planctobacterium marinum TaxID=1631968 RepID=UPI001E2B09A3|nr:radical SAM family heme chaperone HemW [Planctobacterium marinum]MCC2603806.1 radical SAM family heme chaperone HemW [Planctobacterium marinum]
MPPLSLYIHIPWCVQKCPYCDFNSHGIKQGQSHADLPEQEYIMHLLQDLQQDIAAYLDLNKTPREIHSIFIGGGTPSLFSAKGIADILQGVQQQIPFAQDIEITLEANPGTVEAERFKGYVKAGVNRISIGVQSFDNQKLARLGRIHDSQEAVKAAGIAQSVGLNSFNIDIMHGLPEQSLQDALSDLQQAIALNPPHLSWYQLTIEPNTLFYSKPPALPEDEILWDIQEQGDALLRAAGYQQYEISAYSKAGQQCQHNLNYWRFGDYLGIGCGAHGKVTLADNRIVRTAKVKHPKGYMDLTRNKLFEETQVQADDLGFEYFMNRFRLLEPCPKEELEQRTGLSSDSKVIASRLAVALQKGLLTETTHHWQVSELGKRYLNELLSLFLE